VNSASGSAASTPSAAAVSAPGASDGPYALLSRRSFFGCKYTVVFFVRPSTIARARGSVTPVT
jgi:hypothetical protein